MCPLPTMILILSHTSKGVAHQSQSGGDGCPCADARLCSPITTTRAQEGVYAFHTTGNASWRHYDWGQITTVCVFGELDPQLLCKAHSVGARVTLGSGGPPKGSWNNSVAVAEVCHQPGGHCLIHSAGLWKMCTWTGPAGYDLTLAVTSAVP